MADLVARLGSRASVPDEVRSAYGVEEYAALLAGSGDLPAPLRSGRLAPEVLAAVLEGLARPPAAELNKSRLAARAGIPPTTITPYVDALVQLGIVRLVPGTRSSASAPESKTSSCVDSPGGP